MEHCGAHSQLGAVPTRRSPTSRTPRLEVSPCSVAQQFHRRHFSPFDSPVGLSSGALGGHEQPEACNKADNTELPEECNKADTEVLLISPQGADINKCSCSASGAAPAPAIELASRDPTP